MAWDLVPFLAIALLQVGYAGLNIISMLAMQSGMNPLILVVYRLVFATIAIAPFAYFMEWKTRPKITIPILFQLFLCSLTGGTGNMLFYLVGLKHSTPTIGSALSNTLPAFTFILAVLFRQESVGIKTKPGQAKVIGTIICVGGALLLSFYHGHTIGISVPSMHWTYAENMEKNSSTSSSHGNAIIGPLLIIASSLSWSVWFIIQARMNKIFPAPYTGTTLMCFMASIECGIIALFAKHDISAWSLSNPMWLVASLYAGIFCSALAFVITSWAIQVKGPLYVSVFSPLLLVIVAISSWALLHEKLYVGTALGSILIVLGLFAVLWGKNKEMKRISAIEEIEAAKLDDAMIQKDDLELQVIADDDNLYVTTRKEKHQEN
ncbi:WAT1-related protein At1g09380-like isoform X1 [Quercus lobata]|uniref:WAT1-related protein n=1 Tax=Quercus lobata TaxID=97700 RepID=A0A7N2N473_QUELO|nr:WAT1-related protein At1g09380-like isoform X1 [Quercus lobata]